MIRKFDKCSDTKSYKETLKRVFDSLNLSVENQQLLFDVYTNEMDRKELSKKYNLPIDRLNDKITALTLSIRNSTIVNDERENRNLKGR